MLRTYEGLAVDPETVLAVSSLNERSTMLIKTPSGSEALVDIHRLSAEALIADIAKHNEASPILPH